MTRIKNLTDKVIKWILIVLMSVMVINVLWQVFTRFILQDPSSFTDELARYLLIWVGLLGAGYVAGQKLHLALTFVLDKFSEKRKKIIEIIIEILILLFALIALVIGGINLVSLTLYLNQTSAALQVPLGYVYLAIPVSGLLIMFYSLYHIVELVKPSEK